MTWEGLRVRAGAHRWPRIAPPSADRVYGVLLLGVAAALVLSMWRANPNYWYDEAMLVQALRADGWLPPGIPMSQYEQAAPYGAYALQKALVSLFGFRENVLRIPGMLAFIASGFTVWRGARLHLGPGAAWFAGVVTLTAGVAVRQAAQFKHYELELLAAAIILALGLRLIAPGVRRRHVTTYLTASAATMLFSNSAIVAFAATTAAVVGARLLQPPPRDRLRALVVGAACVTAAFAAWYALVLRPALRYQLAYPTYTGGQTLSSFRDLLALLPVPSGTYQSAFWLLVLVGGLLCGLVRRDLLRVITAPVATVVAAGAAALSGVAPFAADRHLLFVLPSLAVIAASAAAAIVGLPFGRCTPAAPAGVLGVLVAVYGAWAIVPATEGNGTSTQQAVGYALTSSADRCSSWWVDWWSQPAATLYADRAGLASRVLGTVSPASGTGQQAWAYRLQNDPGPWQQAMVTHFRTEPGACLLIGTRPDEVPLALDPLRASGLACERFAQMQDAELWSCVRAPGQA